MVLAASQLLSVMEPCSPLPMSDCSAHCIKAWQTVLLIPRTITACTNALFRDSPVHGDVLPLSQILREINIIYDMERGRPQSARL
jgi:hypothetical protein